MGDDHLKQQSNNALQEEGEIKDRISSLHDSLIHHILSYLRTREVTRTGILSKRWKSLWTGVPSLDFEDRRFLCYGTEFLNIIERVLLLRDGISIQRFRLLLSDYYSYEYPLVQLLIAAAVVHNVQQLDIAVSYSVPQFDIDLEINNKDPFTLPCSTFDCRSLNVLTLSMKCNLQVPGRISLPSLKVLHLRSFKFPNAKSIENLFSCCPVLEELTLVQCRLIHLSGINITIPTLKRLVMDFVDDPNSHCYIKVEAPALQFFNYKDKLASSHLSLSKTSSVEKFQLCLSDCVSSDYPCVEKLIAAAVSCKLQELDITLSEKDQFALPCSVFDCQSLSILKLLMKCTLELPNRISLPRLKVLHLCSFAFQNAKSIEDLFSCCHVLEELALSKCRWIQRNSLNISIPSLRRLTMDYSLEKYDIVDDPNDCCYIKVEAPDLRFFNYKGKLTSLLNLSKASSIEKFQLSHHCVDSSGYSRVQSLIAAAISPKIQHVEIGIIVDVDYPDDPLTLPCSVFDCQSLSILKIEMKCTLVVPDNISLPSLKFMYLHSIAFQDAKSIQKWFSCCPVLEELTLDSCKWIQPRSITIYFPSLKKLRMWCSLEDPNDCSITVDAPALMYFDYSGLLTDHMYLTNISSSIKARIDTTKHDIYVEKADLCLVKLLQGLENMVSLTISEDTAKLLSLALALADDTVSEHLPVFHHLKYLVLYMDVKGCVLKGILKFFYFMPNLCSIEFALGVDDTIRRAGIRWMPKPLPKCFLSSLKILSLGYVVGYSPEFAFLSSFLEKVVSLERINIFQCKYIDKDGQERLRSEVKRLSNRFKNCAIIIH